MSLVILREKAVEKIVKQRALRAGCSAFDAESGALAALGMYRKDGSSAHRAIQYGIKFARLLTFGPRKAA